MRGLRGNCFRETQKEGCSPLCPVHLGGGASVSKPSCEPPQGLMGRQVEAVRGGAQGSALPAPRPSPCTLSGSEAVGEPTAGLAALPASRPLPREPPPRARRGRRVVGDRCSCARRPAPSASSQLYESDFVVSGCVMIFLHMFIRYVENPPVSMETRT